MTDTPLLRHFVAALAYRSRRVLEGAPPNFADIEIGYGIRKPVEVLSHMSDVLSFAIRALSNSDEPKASREAGAWDAELRRYGNVLRDLDVALDGATIIDPELAERLLQGPLADAMTHVGQLAMLRRAAGAPIPAENFFAADIVPAL